MIKNVRYKDKHDNIVEAVINIQKGKVIATTESMNENIHRKNGKNE